MNTQKRLNMNIGNYTKTLRDDLRKGLLITLTLLFVCPGVWGQVTQPAGSGTEGSPYQITSAENLAWVCSHGGYAKETRCNIHSAVWTLRKGVARPAGDSIKQVQTKVT